MDLPIDDKELEVIIESVSDVDIELTRKLRLIQEVRDENPGGPYNCLLYTSPSPRDEL